MQPPQFGASFLESLRQSVKEAQAERDRTAQSTINKPKHREIDYVAAVKSWMASQAPATLNKPWSLETIAAQFEGRYKQRPALRLIAQALRANGWVEKRDWTAAGRNRRIWVLK